MKKKLLLIVSVCCFSFSIFAQNNTKWEVNLNYAYQFRFNEFNKNIFNSNQDLHQYGITFQRFFLNKKRIQLLGGLGYSRQQTLGYVGVNHCYGVDGACPEIYIATKYIIQLAEVPVEVRFPINDKISIDLTAISQFRFHQNTDYDIQSKFLFDLNSVEIYPSISYKFNNFRFALGGRLMNWQIPDKLFYYNHSFIQDNPSFYDETLYRYNPLKLRVSASYML